MGLDKPSVKEMNEYVESITNAVNSLDEVLRKDYIKLLATKAMMFEQVYSSYYTEHEDPDEMLRQNGLVALLAVELYDEVVDPKIKDLLSQRSNGE